MVNYPASIDTTQSLPTVIDNFTPVQGSTVNRLRDAILAVENTLGVNPAGIYGTVGNRFATLENDINNFNIIQLAGDLGGTLTDPLVIKLQGRPVSNAAPNLSQVLAWNGISWGPANVPAGGDLTGTYPNPTIAKLQGNTVSASSPTDTYVLTWVAANNDWEPKISFNAAGDLSGTLTSQNVIKINGASVPVSGALLAGNVLKVSGSSALSYGPINLAGGPNSIIGVLPSNNMTTQTMSGDVTGLATSSTVVALQGKSISSTAPTTYQTLSWNGTNWIPLNVPAGGDLTGTYPNPTVNSLQGLSITNGNDAGANEVAVVSYNPIWKNPIGITYDGYNLWVASSSDVFVSKLSSDFTINPPPTPTNFSLPTGYAGYSVLYNNGHIFIGCGGVNSSSFNRLLVLNATTGAIVGIGAFSYNTTSESGAPLHPSGSAVINMTVDDQGNIWTVDTYNLCSFNIASLLSSYPTPVSPASTLAIDRCSDVVFGVTGSLGHHYLFVCDSVHSHIYSIDPTTTSIIGIYTDSTSRTIKHLYFGGGVSGTISVWGTTGSDNHLIRIDPDTMTLLANISSPSTTSLGYIGCDGTYIYASDNSSGYVFLANPATNAAYGSFFNTNIIETPLTSIISSAAMVFDGTFMNVCQSANSSNITGIAQFSKTIGDSGNFYIGTNQLQYITYSQLISFISSYTPVVNSVPIRGNTGEGLFNSIWEGSTVATTGFIRVSSSAQSVISSLSEVNPANNISLISINGADQMSIGDTVNGLQTTIQSQNSSVTLNTFGIASFGGRYDNTTVLSTTGGTYTVINSDRIIIYTGTSGW